MAPLEGAAVEVRYLPYLPLGPGSHGEKKLAAKAAMAEMRRMRNPESCGCCVVWCSSRLWASHKNEVTALG